VNPASNELRSIKKLPWWTWVAPLFIIEIGDRLSALFFQDSIASSFYLPTSLGLILICWVGPARVFPAVFLVSTFNNSSYGISNYWSWLGFGLGDSLAVTAGWFLFVKIFNGKYWLPDTRNLILFLVLGLAVPILIYSNVWQWMYILDGHMGWNGYLSHLRRDLLSELIVNGILVIPVLYFLTPLLSRTGWILVEPIFKSSHDRITKRHWPELVAVVLVLSILLLYFQLDEYWYAFGFVALYVAIRFGFSAVLLANVLIFFFTYLIPSANYPEFTQALSHPENARIFFGYLLLFLFSAVTGRVISDLRFVEHQLNVQNKRLQQANQELDRFVYSASHDMSAPLKSIRGLVNVGRLTQSPDEHNLYFNKIETSVLKLEDFIRDVLDYSRNSRTQIMVESIPLKQLCIDTFNNLQFIDEERRVDLQLDFPNEYQILSDVSRLKIVMNNLLSNAIKYQKKELSYKPFIKISVQERIDKIVIRVEDNGEGMTDEVQTHIFKMFYRGNLKSTGSGLGLYIANEAVEKLGGTVRVNSELGKGSTFIVELPKNLQVI
jgi:two-component system, sensor histidine kinase